MRAWSAAAEAKLTALYATTSLPRLAFLLKRTEAAVKSRAGVLGLRRGNRAQWTARMDAQLRKLYPVHNTGDVAKAMGLTIAQVYNRAFHLGLHKDETFHASDRSTRIKRGRTDPRMLATQFQKGNVPANKGLRRPGWAPGRMRETQFRCGERHGRAAQVYQPIGTVRVSKDGYLERKINDDMPFQKRWRGVHLLLWEEHLGPLPPGFAVAFKNGDKADIRIDNLALVSRAELMRRNSFHNNYPKEIGLAIQAQAALNRQINKRIRNG